MVLYKGGNFIFIMLDIDVFQFLVNYFSHQFNIQYYNNIKDFNCSGDSKQGIGQYE